MDYPNPMTQALPPDLCRAYLDAIYEVDFASGVRQFRHGEAGQAGPAVAIVTAWHPGVSRLSEAESEAANVRLEAWLDEEGYCYVSARGFDDGRSHEEPSFAVLGIELDDALGLAREFGQAAIFGWDGAVGRVVFTE
jgi:hypothetical protein